MEPPTSPLPTYWTNNSSSDDALQIIADNSSGFSGRVKGSPPAERSMDITAWERGLRYVKLMKQSIPAAVHSIVVQTPSGLTRTHRFATETVDLPAQEGERVTVAVAALSNVYRKVGPFKFSPRAPDFYPGVKHWSVLCFVSVHFTLPRREYKQKPMMRLKDFLVPSPCLWTKY
ncbi:hypothetical protein JHK82_013638 [Glycine max]|nr:hypothetical protein JHK85_014011 [Glycine max]KAG5058657.1 hypothetical protein JHK86_013653 [Glycine max]KAG5155669.1 hypothetical protein JHK82_013638 [Glycine max]